MAQEGNDIERSNGVGLAGGTDEARDSSSTALPASDVEDDSTEETEQIREQIEDTRSQMGETIDAIQDRLSFSNLSEQVSDHVQNAVDTAKEAVYDATIGKVAGIMKNVGKELSNSSIIRTAKNDPLPFALIGLGAGLLAYKAYSGKVASGYRNERRRLTQGGAESSTGTDAQSTINGVTDKVSAAAENAKDKISGALDTAYTGASNLVGRAYDKAGNLKGAALEQYDTYLQENPLVLGAAALAVGAAVGMAIPASNYERRVLGETQQKVVDLAQNTASGLLDQTREAITDTLADPH